MIAEAANPGSEPEAATAMTADKRQRDLAHPQCTVTDDEAAATHLRKQRGGSGDAVINADPGGIRVQLGDHEGRYHSWEHLADRREGLLQKHRDQGGQQTGQRMTAPKRGDGGSGRAQVRMSLAYNSYPATQEARPANDRHLCSSRT